MAKSPAGRPCTVCGHPEREAIDQALVRGEPKRAVAAQYTLAEQSIRRHKAEHIPELVIKAQEAADVVRADDLLSQIRGIQARTEQILDSNQGSNDRIALLAIKEARANLELMGKLLGQLQQPTINVLIATPEWLRVQTVILRSLEPYPDAQLAVMAALTEVIDAG
jgi:hypothetical protein